MAKPYQKPEKVDEGRYVDYVEARGSQAPKGAVVGRNGYPDRLTLLSNRRFFWIEFKRPGEDLKRIQKHRIKELRALGHTVYVVDNYAEAVRIFESEAST